MIEGVRRLVALSGRRLCAALSRSSCGASANSTTQRRRRRQAVARNRAPSRGAHVLRGRDPRRAGQDRSRRACSASTGTGAAAGEPYHVTEFLKPGIEEMCQVLPPSLARRIIAIGAKRGWLDRVHVGMYVNTTSVTGYLRFRLLAKLRRSAAGLPLRAGTGRDRNLARHHSAGRRHIAPHLRSKSPNARG